jgi:hypothetical protein
MLILTIIVSGGWGLLIVLGIPHMFGMPLMSTVAIVPDFGYVLLLCAFLAFSTCILEGFVGLNSLSRGYGIAPTSPNPVGARSDE